MKRVFYYSGHRLTVFHWENNSFLGGFAFNPDEEGLESFKKYLLETENVPARIMVDIIEEDYKKEKVPHVGSQDRKAIVKRTLERQYRNSKDYIYHKVIGKEEGVRKEDVVLCTVLTNPAMLDSWFDIIKETETAVSGIWSVPLMSEKLINELELEDDNLILITQQVPSVMRLSFFRKGKFEISRTARVSTDDTPLGLSISIETEQTLSFLTNQRYIGFDDRLTVHIVTSGDEIEKIRTMCIDTPLRSYGFHAIKDVQDKIGSGGLKIQDCGGVFSYICSKQKLPIGHYGPRGLFKHYYERLASKTLYVASVAMILLSTFYTLSLVSETNIMHDEIKLLNQQTVAMENNYTKELETLEPILEKTEAMKSSVLLYNKINKSKKVSPQSFMIEISKVFTLSGMYDTEITSIEWQSTQSQKVQNISTKFTQSINFGSEQEIMQYATIKGFIRVSKSSLKESVEKVRSIINALKTNKSIVDVEVFKMPLDVRSKASLENEGGASQGDAVALDADKGQFEIRLIMKGRKA